MNFKVTIKEFSKGVVDVEAESFEEAKKKVEEDYWKHPNDYLLEPYDTFFE
ncbi:DpnD/PcfM family protein [Anaerotruncus colihominis]|uniref:DpnD/PcfM family protein n=1 Tax=Anaerotruncus colihominis TaxID=169435 RepID=UPI002673E879|nr:DpnD/PcfM family protein [Anaerotruncus colihominis]